MLRPPADTMKTNVPFQAPGINDPPRGKGQEQGTNPKQVFKNIKKTIKEQNCKSGNGNLNACGTGICRSYCNMALHTACTVRQCLGSATQRAMAALGCRQCLHDRC